MTDFLDTMAQHKQRVHARLMTNKQPLLAALRQLGAKSVAITYAGSGDSGQIESLTVCDAQEQELNLDAATVTVLQSEGIFGDDGFHERTEPRTQPLNEALESFLYDWLEDTQPGWEINDGSSGECTIDVEDARFNLDHTNYYTESYSQGYSL